MQVPEPLGHKRRVHADGDVADLGDTIRQIMAELTRAMHEGKGEDLLFGLGPVELEFMVDVNKETTAGGGIKINVITLGGKKTSGQTNSRKIKLTFDPLDANSDPARIAATGQSEIPGS